MSNSGSVGTDVLRVDFERRGDRYAHQVAQYFPDRTGGLLISQEGLPEDAWPPSPVLQSLNLETWPGKGQTAMLVGMAGRSHWSMSVEVDAQRNRLLFDVACRVHEPPVWLGSIYEGFNQHGQAWPLDCLSLTAWHGDRLEEEIAFQIDRLNGSVRISAPSAVEPFPQTIRWRYAIGIKQ